MMMWIKCSDKPKQIPVRGRTCQGTYLSGGAYLSEERTCQGGIEESDLLTEHGLEDQALH